MRSFAGRVTTFAPTGHRWHMSYQQWAILALVSYSMVAPLIKLATEEIPPNVALVVANGTLVVAGLAVLVATDVSVTAYLGHPRAVYMYGAGLFLAVGILAYYRALAAGPVSVVVPIFGMFIVTTAVIGFLFLDEAVTTRKLAGIGFAALAIYLTAGQG